MSVLALTVGVLLPAASSAVSNDASAGAVILEAMIAIEESALEFGAVAGNSGLVTIEADGTRSCSGDLHCIGKSSAAVFRVQGTEATAIQITVSPTVRLEGPDGRLLAATLNLDRSQAVIVNGAATVAVGGTLSLDGSERAGAYSGQFNVEIGYE